MNNLRVYYNARPVAGLATAETNALLDKVHEWKDLADEHAAILDDEWESLADAEEQRRAEAELREGKTPGKGRKSVREEWAVKRAHVLAQLKLIQEEIRPLDRATQAAIKRDAAGAVAQVSESLTSRMAAYEQAAQDLKRAAADLRAAIDRAFLVKGIAQGKAQARIPRPGLKWVNDDYVNYQVTEVIRGVKHNVSRLASGVRFMAGDTVLFSTPGGLVEKVLDAEGAALLNAKDAAAFAKSAGLPAGSVPVMEEGVSSE
ncbi:hypothetical protein AB0C74_26965 [Spirillospora sp. NPDC048832]